MRGICVAFGAIGLFGAGASADTINLKFAGAGAGRNVRITLGSTTQTVFAGQLRHTFSNPVGPVAAQLSGTITTFCSDANELVRSVSTTYTLTEVANLPVSSGWPAMGAIRAQGVYDLYAAAGGAQLVLGANADLAAAFQILLWELVYDFNGSRASLNNTVGTMQTRNSTGGALSSAIMGHFNTLADAVVAFNTSQHSLIGLSRLGAQDQIVQGVTLIPLPAPVMLGAAGLGLVALVRRRLPR